MHARVAAFVARRWRVADAQLVVDVHPLRGGLESAVTLARIATHGRSAAPGQLVVKELPAGWEREADIYEWLWRHVEEPPAVRVFGRETSARTTYLYLENVEPTSPWPWTDIALGSAVCRVLARLHDSASHPEPGLTWDYEIELAGSAHATLELAYRAVDPGGRRFWRRPGDLKRVVRALPAIRSRLLSSETTVIHGDVHPGNVILRRGHPNPDVVLIDWARTRIGSALEDVASWLHSLGCWEPQARRRHDTLMRAYLEARSVRRPFTGDVRFDYWLASASNGLSGAIRYHLAVVADPATTDAARCSSGRALAAWQRVICRAAALLSTSSTR